MRRSPNEQQVALDCLKLAHSSTAESGWEFVIRRADRYYAFVTGDDAADRLAKVREALT